MSNTTTNKKTRIRVSAKRPSPLTDLGIVDILDFNTEFDIDIMQQFDDGTPELKHKVVFTPDAINPPIPPEPPVDENLIYDSNRDGKWNNGKARDVEDEDGDVSPNCKGLYMAASGDPVLHIDGKGEAILECDPGHGRFYVMVNHYNAVLEKEFKIMDSSVDNVSDKLRSNHQEGGDCEDRFGGFGGSISLSDCGCKIEMCHNEHGDSEEVDLPKKLEVGKWYKDRFQIRDSEDGKSVLATRWIDYGDGNGFKTVLTHKMTQIEPYMMDRARYEKKSYFWLRMNNEKKGRIAFRNVKLFNIPDTTKE